MPISSTTLFVFTMYSDTANNIARTEQPLDSVRGEDSWCGRRVQKYFPVHGTFLGTITGVDEDADNIGCRIFQCTYSDGDKEWISAADVSEIMLSEEESVTKYCMHECVHAKVSRIFCIVMFAH